MVTSLKIYEQSLQDDQCLSSLSVITYRFNQDSLTMRSPSPRPYIKTGEVAAGSSIKNKSI